MLSAYKYKFCRLCLCINGSLVDLLEEDCGDKSTMKKAVHDFLQIKVTEEEHLHWMVCHGCLVRLVEFQDFRIRCIKNNMLYNHMFDSKTQTKFPLGQKLHGKEVSVNLMAHNVEEGGVEDGLRKPIDKEDMSSEQNSGDEDTKHDDIDYCWCVECHRDFLNFKELKVHSEVCSGLGEWNHGKENRLTSAEEEREVPFEVNCADPGLSCARCKRDFRSLERLEGHINKYDFKCKAKSVKEAEIGESGEGTMNERVCLYFKQEEEKCHRNKSSTTKTNAKDAFINNESLEIALRDERRVIHTTNVQKVPQKLNGVTALDLEGEDVKNVISSHVKRSNLLLESDVQHNFSKKRKKEEFVPLAITSVDEDGYKTKSKCSQIPQETPMTYEAPSANILNVREVSITDGVTGCNDSLNKCKSLGDNISSEAIKVTAVIETGTYICDYCGNPYSDKSNLRSHMVKVHLSLNPQNCPVCHKHFMNDEEFQIHFKSHPKDKKFFCTICEEHFFSKALLRSHILESHESKVAQVCTACGNGFKSKGDLGVHQSIVHTASDRNFKCSGCGSLFMNKKHFRKHFEICVLKSVSYKCDLCGKDFSSRQGVKLHSFTHQQSTKYPCTMCPKTFARTDHRDLHIKVCHLKIRPHECGICNRTFSTKSALMRHYMSHSDDRPFRCAICHRAFKSKSALKRHLTNIHKLQRSELDVNILLRSCNE